MPELPEVESTRRHLVPHLSGAVISDVEVARARMVRRQEQPGDFERRLAGRQVVDLGRHGKFLEFHLDSEVIWVTHLGMSGRVQVATAADDAAPHTNVIVRFESGSEFRLIDPRTFGFVAAYTPDELAASPIGRLGPDALTDLPRSRDLTQRLDGRTAPIKPLLLDQTIVAGLGNIYADEVLHHAAIAPTRAGGALSPKEVTALRRGIVVTLERALASGGTSLDDLAYLLPDGRTGDYVARLRVYGREGEPCRRCGAEIRRIVLRQRSTYWCPGCQT